MRNPSPGPAHHQGRVPFPDREDRGKFKTNLLQLSNLDVGSIEQELINMFEHKIYSFFTNL